MLRPLRSVWAEPAPPDVPGPGPRDAALAGAVVLLAVAEAVLRPDVALRWLVLASTLTIAPALLVRRTHPGPAVVLVLGAAALVTVLSAGRAQGGYASAFALLLLHALTRWGSGREIVLGLAVALTAVAASLVASGAVAADVVGSAAVVVATLAVGVAARARAAARRRELEQVALLERERLARDLHDTVAHHVSAVAIRAQAGLANAERDPSAALEALRVIETEASTTLAEMRTMVRALRTVGRPPTTGGRLPAGEVLGGRGHPRGGQHQPGGARRVVVPALIDLQRLAGPSRAGPPVRLRVSGDVASLAPGVAEAAHRLAQESVTNARRHARGATRIEVRVDVGVDAVRITVSDDGHGDATSPAGASGFGLVGMAERAALLGGTCTAGPAGPDRGWTVEAVLPRTAARP